MTVLGLILLVLFLLALRQSVLLILIAVGAYAHLVWGASELSYLVQDMWSTVDKEAILALPLFIMVGQIMSRGSIAQRLIDVMEELTQPLPGGLGVAAILSCAVFSAISGSSIVTLMAVGTIMYPALIERGYRKHFAIGALAAGGTLGMIIPPSIPMILYGVATETSITDLFLAGIGPGLLIAGVLSTYAVITHRHLPRGQWDLRRLSSALSRGGWSLMLPVLLLGGIYSGYFSPTEAAAVAVLYSLLVETLFHREMSLQDFYQVNVETGKLVGLLFPLIAVAVSLNLLATTHQIPQQLVQLSLAYVDSPLAFMLLANLILLVAGCFIDPTSAILIMGPLLAPIAEAYQYDSILFGIVMILNLEIGFLTPPVGLNLIVAMTVFRERFGLICRSVVPFILLLIACLALVVLVPSIAMWLVG